MIRWYGYDVDVALRRRPRGRKSEKNKINKLFPSSENKDVFNFREIFIIDNGRVAQFYSDDSVAEYM